MIYLELFLAFLKVGALSFGGGLGMISLIYDICVSSGWLSEAELLNMIALAESTPGPIAVNIATFVGSSQGGFFGALCATLGIVLPSFVIILIIASLATLTGMRPAIVGLIISVTVTMLLGQVFSIETVASAPSFEWRGAVILTSLALFTVLYTKLRKKALSPIILILVSGALGMLLY